MIMENKIGAGKKLEEVYALVEYTFDFDNHFDHCSCDEEPYTEYEKCLNLKELLAALSTDQINEWKEKMDAKVVKVTNVIMQGKNEDGDSAHISLSNRETRGFVRAKVSEDQIESKMNDCVKEIEKQLQGIQGTISRYRV